MAQKKKEEAEQENQVFVDNVNYGNLNDLNKDQIYNIRHLKDISTKIENAEFQLFQLKVSRASFLNAFKESFTEKKTD